MALPNPLVGGCACGKIRYEANAAPVFGGYCCCRACQHSTGSGFAAVIGVPSAAFRVTQGEPRYFESKADSGATARRQFAITSAPQAECMPESCHPWHDSQPYNILPLDSSIYAYTRRFTARHDLTNRRSAY